MFSSIFSSLIPGFKRIQRARLRQMMRGYRALKQAGQLDRVAVVKQALTEHPLDIGGKHFSSDIMGCAAASYELIVRQYLLVRVGGFNMNFALLLARGAEDGRVVFPLPKEWRDVLTQHGFKVAQFRSAVLWQLYVCALLLYGVVKIAKVALAGITSPRAWERTPERYVHFVDLGPGNLPRVADDNRSHDVISWYLQWPGRKSDIEAIHHSVANSSPVTIDKVSVLPQKGSLPALGGWRKAFSYFLWGLRATAIATIDCLRGRWWHALLLNQAASAAQVNHLPANSLAREYLFHNAGWIYRPLWTYEAERLGSTVSLYFYSTNCEAFKRSDGYPPMPFGWKAMTWPHYLVWDDYQADFVRRAVGSQANISIVGAIWFQSSIAVMPSFEMPCVAVFDVTPHRVSSYRRLGMDSEFYTPAVTNPFMTNVSNAAQRHALLLLWKRKRNIGRVAHPQYRFLADRLAEEKHIVLVDPDMAADRVIESSAVVISMPFTSTALIARSMGKPSAYYDPTGLLQRDDRAAHGIPILLGENELDAWISLNVRNQ